MTKLNGVNMFSDIIKHSISVINYHIGLLKLDQADFESLILRFTTRFSTIISIYNQPLRRGYIFLRKIFEEGWLVLGTGVKACFWTCIALSWSRRCSLRHAATLKVKQETNSYLLQILGYLRIRYWLVGIITFKMLL